MSESNKNTSGIYSLKSLLNTKEKKKTDNISTDNSLSKIVRSSLEKNVIKYDFRNDFTNKLDINKPNLKLQTKLKPETIKTHENGEKRIFRCFCDDLDDDCLLVKCSICNTWQHGKCVNITKATIPDKYVCPICLGKYLRCKCNSNLLYGIPYIQCTKCNYYVHRECEYFGLGPVILDNFCCYNCGGYKFKTPNIKMIPSLRIPNKFTPISFGLIQGFHRDISNFPYYSVLQGEFERNETDLYKLCEKIYCNYREYFYLIHPHSSSRINKKKRSDLTLSFFKSLFMVLQKLFGVQSDVVLLIFDRLAQIDLYKVPYQNVYAPYTSAEPLEFSECCLEKIIKSKHMTVHELALLSPDDFTLTDKGLYTKVPLKHDQLIYLIPGFVGLVDEFFYDDGIDRRYHSMVGSKQLLVLDSGEQPQFIDNFRRSLHPNCTIKLIKYKEQYYAGVFTGSCESNVFEARTRKDKITIAENTELTLPIDLPPGDLRDNENYNWKFEEELNIYEEEVVVHKEFKKTRMTREERSVLKIKQLEAQEEERMRRKYREKENKKVTNNKMQKKHVSKPIPVKEQPVPEDTFLTKLFGDESFTGEQSLIEINSDEEDDIEMYLTHDDLPETSKVNITDTVNESILLDLIDLTIPDFINCIREKTEALSYEHIELPDITESFDNTFSVSDFV